MASMVNLFAPETKTMTQEIGCLDAGWLLPGPAGGRATAVEVSGALPEFRQ
ncbi:MAG: hypothetical protein JWN03_5016 [Nocardia sp.]|nr:hypothetical protein [Nocardia sp.]